jgi:hypothetical protein
MREAVRYTEASEKKVGISEENLLHDYDFVGHRLSLSVEVFVIVGLWPVL